MDYDSSLTPFPPGFAAGGYPRRRLGWRAALGRVAVVVGLFVLSAYEEAVFRAVVEVFCLGVAAGITLYAWNARAIIRDAYSSILGAGFLWMALLDLMHAFAFPTVRMLPGASANEAALLWMGARLVQTLALVLAPLFVRRQPAFLSAGALFGLLAGGLITAVAYGGLPEVVHADGSQTRSGAQITLVLAGLLLASLALTWRARQALERETHRLMIWSILLSVSSLLLLSLADARQGFASAGGQILKAISFYFVYRAILLRGTQRPFESLYRDVIESRARFRAVFDRMVRPAIIVQPGPDDSFPIRGANAATVAKAGMPLDELVGTCAYRLLRDRFSARLGSSNHATEVRAALCRVRDSGAPATHAMVSHNPDGTLAYWVDLDLFPGSPGEIVVIARARTDEMRMVEAMRQASDELRRLHEAQHRKIETERRRIAQEIHDELGQVATALTMGLDRLERRVASFDPKLAEAAAKMKGLSASTVDTVRRICAELRPSQLLDVVGLPEAIDAKLRDFEAETGIEATLHVTAEGPPLEQEPSGVLYRILQESLTNVARHSMAGTVTVSMVTTPTEARLTVEDDGRGITPEEAAAETAFGVIGMRERAQAIGGRVDIVGAPDRGTRVLAVIPRATLG